METRVLMLLHEHSNAWLDELFLVSHAIGAGPFGLVLVLVAAAVAAYRKKPHEAGLWIALGLSTYFLQAGLKEIVGRPRPALWPTLVSTTSPAFPSGHALAAATFYPLLARAAVQRWPEARVVAWAAAVAMALYIGLGRLYLGVHWPSDVLAGWAIGAAQTMFGIGVVARLRTRAPAALSANAS
jgi:undecaprenyl-diphosphatase